MTELRSLRVFIKRPYEYFDAQKKAATNDERAFYESSGKHQYQNKTA
jgi:hypothetical protein